MGNNYLHLNKVYPGKADKLLWGVDRKSEDIMDKGIYVLDTNVLLTLYSTSNSSLKEIENLYKQLKEKGQLYIPSQVIREFVSNRTERIKNIYAQISDKFNKYPVMHCKKYPILENNSKFKELYKIENEIKAYLTKQQDTYNEITKSLKKEIKTWLWNDPVSEMYKSIFEGIIYEIAIEEKQHIEEWQIRFEQNNLPGSNDAKKENNFDGDLIIWKTILKIGHEKKNDWWDKSNNECLYPKFELMNEFYNISDGHVFLLLKQSDFIEYFKVNASTIKEIKEIEKQEFEINEIVRNQYRNIYYRATNALLTWANNKYEDASLYINDIYEKSPSILLTTKNGEKIGLDIYVIHSANFKSGWWFRLCEKLMGVHSDIVANKYCKWYLFIVTDNSEYIDKIIDSRNKLLDFYSSAEIVIGLIGNDNQFEQIF